MHRVHMWTWWSVLHKDWGHQGSSVTEDARWSCPFRFHDKLVWKQIYANKMWNVVFFKWVIMILSEKKNSAVCWSSLNKTSWISARTHTAAASFCLMCILYMTYWVLVTVCVFVCKFCKNGCYIGHVQTVCDHTERSSGRSTPPWFTGSRGRSLIFCAC